MKRRSFLQAAAAAPVVAVIPTTNAMQAVPVLYPFVKAGALRPSVDCDLTSTSLEDAIVCMAMQKTASRRVYPTPNRFTIVVPGWQIFQAARVVLEWPACTAKELVDELSQLHDAFPFQLPRVDFRTEDSFTDFYEWGLVADNGRCFYSPGA